MIEVDILGYYTAQIGTRLYLKQLSILLMQ